MTFIEIWGWLAAAFTATLSLPQLIRLLRVRTSAGLSLLSWQMMLAANIPWVAHGVMTNRMNLALPNAALFVCTILILRMIRRDRGLGLLQTYAMGTIAGVAAFGVDVIFGAAAFGTLVTIPQAIGQLAQLRDLLRLRDIRGLSWVFLTVSFGLQFMWIYWAFAVNDNAVKVAASMMAILAGANLLVYVLRRLDVIKPPGGPGTSLLADSPAGLYSADQA